MIVIDKSSATTVLIVTISENITIPDSEFKLSLYSGYTNKEFEITLPDNLSPHSKRFDQFEFDSSVFNSLETGNYYYTITQVDDDAVLEIGSLEIKGTPTVEFVSPIVNETDDDLLVYQG